MSREIGSVENGVLFGGSDHLFLVAGAHDVLAFLTGKREPARQSIDTFSDNLQSRQVYANQNGIPYLHIVHPDKHSVLVDEFPIAYSASLGDIYLQPAGKATPMFLYPKIELRRLGSEVFLHTDTHLSDRGVVAVASLVVGHLLRDALAGKDAELIKMITKPVDHCGDLGRKFEPAISHRESFARKGWDAVSVSNRLQSNDGIVDIWLAPKALVKGRVVLFGDSFGRDLCKFLSFFFSETVFLRTPFFHSEMADLLKPDFLLTQNVERYLSFVRPDEERPNFFMYPYLKVAGPAAVCDQRFGAVFSGMLSQKRKPYLDIAAEFGLSPKAIALPPSAEPSASLTGLG